MHQHEHAVTEAKARALIAAQMPDLSGPLHAVDQAGTDNVLFRLGSSLVARFPRLPHAEHQIALQSRWLPGLQAVLPLTVPCATRFGRPGEGYPFAWSVVPWLAGQDAHAAPPDLPGAAQDLARFLLCLQGHPVPPDAPDRTLAHSLDLRLRGAEHAIAQITELSDHDPLLRFLAAARALPPPQGPQVWTHGDLHPLNLLTTDGKLSAVIDWGAMGAGDPAIDLMLAWTLLDPPARAQFRSAMNPDPEAWNRARALAFGKAIVALPYYRHSNPPFHSVMRQTLTQVLLESEG